MSEIKTEFLFTITLEFDIHILGDTPYGFRRVGRLTTGSFEGPKLKGTVLPGGGSWVILRRDDVLEIEVRIILETDDKQHIYVHWKGASPWPEGAHGSPQSRRECRPSLVLFQHHAVLRDEFGKVRLDEPHLLDCHRLSQGERADLRGVSGVVGTSKDGLRVAFTRPDGHLVHNATAAIWHNAAIRWLASYVRSLGERTLAVP
jgi:hypothetical protein